MIKDGGSDGGSCSYIDVLNLYRVGKAKQLWTEDQDEELRLLYARYNEERSEGTYYLLQVKYPNAIALYTKL